MSPPTPADAGPGGGPYSTWVRLVLAIEWLNLRVGQTVSWLAALMVFIAFLVAALRYGFGIGRIALQESYVWMHAILFLLAAPYTFLADGHVRIDIFYRTASIRAKAWINIIGTLVLLFPTLGLIWWVTYPYVALSWFRMERSQEAGGLPGLFLLKGMMLAFVVLVGLQGLSLVIRSILVLSGRLEWDPELRASKGEI